MDKVRIFFDIKFDVFACILAGKSVRLTMETGKVFGVSGFVSVYVS